MSSAPRHLPRRGSDTQVIPKPQTRPHAQRSRGSLGRCGHRCAQCKLSAMLRLRQDGRVPGWRRARSSPARGSEDLLGRTRPARLPAWSGRSEGWAWGCEAGSGCVWGWPGLTQAGPALSWTRVWAPSPRMSPTPHPGRSGSLQPSGCVPATGTEPEEAGRVSLVAQSPFAAKRPSPVRNGGVHLRWKQVPPQGSRVTGAERLGLLGSSGTPVLSAWGEWPRAGAREPTPPLPRHKCFCREPSLKWEC